MLLIFKAKNLNLSTITITSSQSQIKQPQKNSNEQMPPPAVPPLQNQTNSKDVNSQKRIQLINENLLRITLIKTDQFEDEYIIKEVKIIKYVFFKV
jgi:hypothetical protein